MNVDDLQGEPFRDSVRGTEFTPPLQPAVEFSRLPSVFDRAHIEEHLAAFIHEYQPVGPVEAAIVRRLSSASGRHAPLVRGGGGC